MAISKIVKSVILHDGMGDDADRFLLEPPAVDYAENLRIDKTGSLQKRPGFGPTALATVPDANGDPFFIHAIDDNLHVLTEDGSRTYSNGAWVSQDATGFIGTRRMEVETPPVGGMGHIDHIVFYDDAGDIHRYVTCYEVREESQSSTILGYPLKRPKHVVVQTFDSDGNFVSQHRIDGAQSPKLTRNALNALNNPIVWFQRVSDGELVRGIVQTDGDVVLQVGQGIYPSSYFAMESHGSKVGSPTDPLAVYGPLIYSRLGASSDQMARYQVTVDTDNETYIVLYQRRTALYEGDLWMARLNWDANLQANIRIYDGTPGASMHEAFDIIYAGAGSGVCYIQFGRYTATSPNRESSVFVERRSTLGVFTKNIWPTIAVRSDIDAGNADFYGRTYCHGGLTQVPGGVSWFAHDAGEAVVDQFDHVRDPNTGLWHGMLDGNGDTVGTDRFLPHHRLATRPISFNGELYAAVQQWTDMTPYTPSVKDYDDYADVWGAIKPRTTALVAFDQTANVARPVAYFDSGQSKTSEYAESEWTVHIPRIIIDDGQMLVPNRLVIHAEDLSLNMSDLNAGGDDARIGNAESPSDAMMRIHRVAKGNSGIAEIKTAAFGDGVALSTAIPLWFDGHFFGEFGPIDSPEIISVTDTRMSNETPPTRPRIGFGLEDNEAPNPEYWTKMQVVVGYYDSKGNKHRSAPSTLVYVDDLSGFDPKPDPNSDLATTWRGKSVQVYYTMPLSALPSDLEYFVEVYAGSADADSLQLVDTESLDLSATQPYSAVVSNVQLVRFRNSGPNFNRPQRTSRTLYTLGGELPADPWPSFTNAVVTSTRLFALDATNKGKVLVSKEFQDFIAPEYNALLDINLGDERDLTAIGRLDDKVVVFEKNDIHVIYGQGPDEKGRGEDFAVHYIATDIGCEDQESIVETPAGLIFYSKQRGFHMLDRNLQVKFIGGGIEDLARGINVVAATLVPDRAEVRFIFTGGPDVLDRDGPEQAPETVSLVDRPATPVFTTSANNLFGNAALTYNYERGTWMTYSNYDGAAATIYQGKYTMLRNDWDVWQESETRYDDPTGLNPTRLKTPWIKLSEQVQGFQRLWRMTVLGRYLSSLQDMGGGVYEASDIGINIYYDYEAEPTQMILKRFQDLGYDPFNSPKKRAERLQLDITPNRGRCQAVKLDVFEAVPDGTTEGLTYKLGHGFEIASIDFHIGVAPSRALIQPKAKR